MTEFLKAVEANSELKAKIDELDKNPQATAADYIALANQYGFELTEADFSLEPSKELDEDELACVSGGKECYCMVGGGGSGGGKDDVCACVIGGGGNGEPDAGSNCDIRCVCLAAGTGDTRNK